MTEKKKRINAVIPEELYIKISESGYSLTEAIIKGIELVLENKKGLKEVQELDNKQPMLEELTHLRTKSEELQAHNETLKRELEKAGQDKEDIKKTFDNYMVQVQTLINQKAIEAPGEKKPWWRFW
jgi:predicted DsbA family dithiol-disulfide isomerase